MASAQTKSAIPSHLKNAANGSDGFAERHHGKSQSHVVSPASFFSSYLDIFAVV